MNDDRLMRLENEVSVLKPKVETHAAKLVRADEDIAGIKNTTAGIFNRLNDISTCVNTMPQKVSENIQACRSELEKGVKKHVKDSYVRKEHAIMPKHIIMAGMLISAVMGFVTYINKQAEESNGSGVSSLIEKVQSGEITINKHDHSTP